MKAILAMALGSLAIVACDQPVDHDDGDGTAKFPATCAAADELGPYESDPGPYPATSLADLAAACAEIGVECPQAVLLTRQQAICIAVDEGLPLGILPLQADLHVHFGLERPIWSVSSTEFVGPGEKSGTEFAIDARTGEIVEESGWGWYALSRDAG